MRKILLLLSVLVMGMLLSMFSSVSAEGGQKIQIGQPFHLGERNGAILEDVDVVNGERIRLRITVTDILPAPAVELSWMLSFLDLDDLDDNDGNRAIGIIPNIYHERNTLNINGMYELNILNINWNEGESARYVELMVERIVDMEIGQGGIGIEQFEQVEGEGENIEIRRGEYFFQIVGIDSQNSQTIEKQRALGGVILKLKDYITSAKREIENSQLISGEEKAVLIEKLNEKNTAIEEYLPQIVSIKNPKEVELVKSRLKAEIKEIKPIVEKPIIKIHEDKISKIINKLEILSGKLEKVISILDIEDQNKIKELKDLIRSANRNINKAKKLYKNDIADTTEVKLLLRQAIGDIKEAFILVREILSSMERDILYEDLETESKEEYIKETKEVSPIMSVSGTGDLIENIYININEPFELYEGQSAKLIDNIISSRGGQQKKSIIITLKNWKGDDGAGTNINYWLDNDHISNKYIFLKENQKIVVDDYTIELLSTREKKAKYIVKSDYNDKPIEEDKWNEYRLVLGIGEIHKDYEGSEVEVSSISIYEDKCIISYDNLFYTLNLGEQKSISDNVIITLDKINEEKCVLSIKKRR